MTYSLNKVKSLSPLPQTGSQMFKSQDCGRHFLFKPQYFINYLERALLNFFYKASVTLVPKVVKNGITKKKERKRKYRPIFLMNIVSKIFKDILAY